MHRKFALRRGTGTACIEAYSSSLSGLLVKLAKTPPFHGGNTGSSPVQTMSESMRTFWTISRSAGEIFHRDLQAERGLGAVLPFQSNAKRVGMKRELLNAQRSSPISISLLVEDYHEYAQPLIKRLFLEESQCAYGCKSFLYAIAGRVPKGFVVTSNRIDRFGG